MNVIWLLALTTGSLYPQEIFLVLLFVRDCVDPKAIMWRVGYVDEKSQ